MYNISNSVFRDIIDTQSMKEKLAGYHSERFCNYFHVHNEKAKKEVFYFFKDIDIDLLLAIEPNAEHAYDGCLSDMEDEWEQNFLAPYMSTLSDMSDKEVNDLYSKACGASTLEGIFLATHVNTLDTADEFEKLVNKEKGKDTIKSSEFVAAVAITLQNTTDTYEVVKDKINKRIGHPHIYRRWRAARMVGEIATSSSMEGEVHAEFKLDIKGNKWYTESSITKAIKNRIGKDALAHKWNEVETLDIVVEKKGE